jgi:predicted nucleic acid-binding protein
MKDNIFFDTNIWFYLFSKSDLVKKSVIIELLNHDYYYMILSPQVIGEFYNTCFKKRLIIENEINSIIKKLLFEFKIGEINYNTIIKTLEIKEKNGYTYWDSQIIASALLNGCNILYSEDMQHNQIIEKKLKIINPFI